MKKLPVNSFNRFAISKVEENSTKGGIFCELYIGYTESNKGVSYDPAIMAQAMIYDQILAQEGLKSAMAHGGQAFVTQYA